jgi:hypothetical protein
LLNAFRAVPESTSANGTAQRFLYDECFRCTMRRSSHLARTVALGIAADDIFGALMNAPTRPDGPPASTTASRQEMAAPDVPSVRSEGEETDL